LKTLKNISILKWSTIKDAIQLSPVKSYRQIAEELTRGAEQIMSDRGWDKFPDWAQFVAQSLLQALKERDPYTYGHCRRVARHARLLAEAAGLTQIEQRMVEYASMFHDLGKMGIPDRILLKPGRLTDEEEAVMRAHPQKSVDILQPLTQVTFFKGVIPGVKHHHERYDGKGYPDGVMGDHIPLIARIILIADTYDAMTTTRPYRNGMDPQFAYKELKLFAGRQFDKQLVDIFLKAHPTWGEMEEDITQEFVAAHFPKAA
jgi:HD-GYP domain-containing protein (c-di-GMP phosphodiesterase class II)